MENNSRETVKTQVIDAVKKKLFTKEIGECFINRIDESIEKQICSIEFIRSHVVSNIRRGKNMKDLDDKEKLSIKIVDILLSGVKI